MTEEPASDGASPPTKRTYSRRAPLCRLCLHDFPKDDLQEIFSRGSDWKKRIFRATGIKPHRNDPATRLCTACRMMIDLIVSFQEICQQTEQLMRKGGGLSSAGASLGDRWAKASGLIDSLWNEVTQRQEAMMMLESGMDDDDEATTMTTVETKQEIFVVSVPAETEEVLEEERLEDEEQPVIDADQLEIKEEDDEEEEGIKVEEEAEDEVAANDDRDGDYQYEEEQESDDEEESEEEQSPKRKRGRRKLDDETRRRTNEARRRLKSEKVMCDTCGELVSQICLEGHLNRHLGVKPFVCEIEGCGRRLYSNYSLQQHRHLHKSMMRYYDCSDCGKRIKGTSAWMRHKKLHTEEPKHGCNVCGKKFRRKFGLKLHEVVHTGVALFPCEICGKRFTVKHNLGAHYKMHKRNGTYPKMDEGQQCPQTIMEEHLEYNQADEQCTT